MPPRRSPRTTATASGAPASRAITGQRQTPTSPGSHSEVSPGSEHGSKRLWLLPSLLFPLTDRLSPTPPLTTSDAHCCRDHPQVGGIDNAVFKICSRIEAAVNCSLPFSRAKHRVHSAWCLLPFWDEQKRIKVVWLPKYHANCFRR